MALHYDTTETAGLGDADAWLAELDTVQRELAVAPTVPRDTAQRLWHVLGQLPTDPASLAGLDPYLAQAFLGGAVQSLKALHETDQRAQRGQLRVAVEQLRQALRDAVADEVTTSDQPAGALARWLIDTLGVPVGEVAGVVGVSTRTFHRWMEDDTATPSAKDAARLACVAQVANQLRHVFSGPGVIGWFTRPAGDLAGETPAALVEQPVRHPELLRAARRYRAMVAA